MLPEYKNSGQNPLLPIIHIHRDLPEETDQRGTYSICKEEYLEKGGIVFGIDHKSGSVNDYLMVVIEDPKKAADFVNRRETWKKEISYMGLGGVLGYDLELDNPDRLDQQCGERGVRVISISDIPDEKLRKKMISRMLISIDQ